jgi:hypothetical protein
LVALSRYRRCVATFTQATLQSTKIIAESLTQWKKVPTAPTLSD